MSIWESAASGPAVVEGNYSLRGSRGMHMLVSQRSCFAADVLGPPSKNSNSSVASPLDNPIKITLEGCCFLTLSTLRLDTVAVNGQ